jgi:hypothetical protein
MRTVYRPNRQRDVLELERLRDGIASAMQVLREAQPDTFLGRRHHEFTPMPLEQLLAEPELTANLNSSLKQNMDDAVRKEVVEEYANSLRKFIKLLRRSFN